MNIVMKALNKSSSWKNFEKRIKSKLPDLISDQEKLAKHIGSIIPFLILNKGSDTATLPDWVLNQKNNEINKLFEEFAQEIENDDELQGLAEGDDRELGCICFHDRPVSHLDLTSRRI